MDSIASMPVILVSSTIPIPIETANVVKLSNIKCCPLEVNASELFFLPIFFAIKPANKFQKAVISKTHKPLSRLCNSEGLKIALIDS